MVLGRRFLGGAAGFLAVAACARPLLAQTREVNVYSSRHYGGDKELVERFTRATGVKVNVVEGDIGPLLQRLASEGRLSPADLLITVDAGNLWRAHRDGLLQPARSAALEALVPAALREPDGHWYALSVRARVVLYDTTRVKPEELSTFEALADPKWKGRILIRSSNNVYNQSLLASIVAAIGPEKAEAWAAGMVANFARAPKGGDTDQILALAAGEGDIAIVNTYYLARLAASPKTEERALAERVGVFFPNQDSRGAHVNISGAGVARHAPNRDNAVRLLEFLLAPEAQSVFAAGNHEYPIDARVARSSVVAKWGEFKADTLAIAELGRLNPEAVRIFDRVGWR